MKNIGLKNLNRNRLSLLHKAGFRLFEMSDRLRLSCASSLLRKLHFSSVASIALLLVGVKDSLLPNGGLNPKTRKHCVTEH